VHHCRHCEAPLRHHFIDLGHQPPSNAYLAEEALDAPEITLPLRVYVCTNCWLVQLPAHAAANELFTPEYAYFSSTSKAWLTHSANYVGSMVKRLALDAHSFVIEVASNDGYLLQYVKERGIRCIGIEPTASTASAARAKGIDTLELFLADDTGRDIAELHGRADLVIANNVLAHVPDINGFLKGIAHILAPNGVATFEFPHLISLLEGWQFDTIYHEHFSYLSLAAVTRIVEAAGLRVFDVEELSSHGGSLRVFVCHSSAPHAVEPAVAAFEAREQAVGVKDLAAYARLQDEAERIKNDLVAFLIGEKRAGRTVAAYGAAAKGNTLLNFAGVRPDLLPFVCDAAVSKQGRFMPGSHIPILPPEALVEQKPRTVLILPWNIADEIVASMGVVRSWGGRFAIAVPRLEID
jgi:SAM-dependent methyltransferase